MPFLKIGKIKIKEINFAITLEEQRNGLMGCDFPQTCTIFPYKKAEVRKFWMHNVPAPLDIIFCRGNKILDIINGKPYCKSLIGSKEPSDLVIETYGGFCAYNEIQIGDDIKIKFGKDNLIKLLRQ